MANSDTMTIRITDSTLKERFNRLADSAGMSNGDLLSEMLTERENAQTVEKMPGRSDDINAFDTSLETLRSLYIASLAIVDTERAETEAKIEARLQGHTTTIDNLNKTIKELEMHIADISSENEELKKKNKEQKKVIEEKESLIQSLRKIIDESSKVQSMVVEMRELLASAKKETSEAEKE